MFGLLLEVFRDTNAIVVGGLAFLVLYLVVPRFRSKGPLPPGPRGLPVIGNALDMPKDYEWEHWAKHKDLYGSFIPLESTPDSRLPSEGPISSVNALGTRVIIINDLQIAIDLLETRSSIYSNRPVFPFAGEMYASISHRYVVLNEYPLFTGLDGIGK